MPKPEVEEVTVHLQLDRREQANWPGHFITDTHGNSLRILSSTLTPPTQRKEGSRVVTLKLRIPTAAFTETAISATIDVPADAMHEADAADVTVEVT